MDISDLNVLTSFCIWLYLSRRESWVHKGGDFTCAELNTAISLPPSPTLTRQTFEKNMFGTLVDLQPLTDVWEPFRRRPLLGKRR